MAKKKKKAGENGVEWGNLEEAAKEKGCLARCGNWRAELAYKYIYTEGLVFIRYEGKDKVPAYFGDQKKSIQEPAEAMILIDEVSRRMCETLTCPLPCKCQCQNVYVVSLNEGDWENTRKDGPASLGIHFRLLPRYQHDRGFLKRINSDGTDNDGFALMAEWRKQFLLRKKFSKWDSFTISEDGRPKDSKAYAISIAEKLLKE